MQEELKVADTEMGESSCEGVEPIEVESKGHRWNNFVRKKKVQLKKIRVFSGPFSIGHSKNIFNKSKGKLALSSHPIQESSLSKSNKDGPDLFYDNFSATSDIQMCNNRILLNFSDHAEGRLLNSIAKLGVVVGDSLEVLQKEIKVLQHGDIVAAEGVIEKSKELE